MNKRKQRRFKQSRKKDQRNEFERDRDRLIYSFAFRRLAQVTQVAHNNEGHVFHNRLTHSLKVAQVGRRLSEYLLAITDAQLIKKCGKLDPNVVETACLAHDLGHPPFGHIAEKELDKVAIAGGLADGFEGNAQTLRILAKLEPYKPNYPGLNLTRATLNATLKYPWFREQSQNAKKTKKWHKFSIYELDRQVFEFIRPTIKERNLEQQSLEASIMEYADDITYSVHDLEDFYLAGLIPLDLLVKSNEEWSGFISDWLKHIHDQDIKSQVANKNFQKTLKNFLSLYLLSQYSPNSIEQITNIRHRSSFLIQRYIQGVSVSEQYGKYGYLKRDLNKEVELELLQRIVWKYVIKNPRLASQKHGQKKIIRNLFTIYKEAIENNELNLIPPRFLKDGSIHRFLDEGDEAQQKIRLAVDIVASFTESEAVLVYRRLNGLEHSWNFDYLY